MEPIFTLPYSEFCVAQRLSKKYFPSKKQYSVYVPLSRQQKGVDLILAHRSLAKENKLVTIQVKASRSYDKLKGNYDSSFNTFNVPPEADFIFFVIVYPLGTHLKSRKSSSVWSELILVFRYVEMVEFIKVVKRAKQKLFYFAFNDEAKEIKVTRPKNVFEGKDYSKYLLENRIEDIKDAFKMKNKSKRNL